MITYPSLTTGAVGFVIDGGLFMSAPTVVQQGSTPITTAATLANVFGGRSDIVNIQPAP
jgi:hypothetical protein